MSALDNVEQVVILAMQLVSLQWLKCNPGEAERTSLQCCLYIVFKHHHNQRPGHKKYTLNRINYRVLVRLEFVSRTWALSRNVKMFSIIRIKITYLSIIIDIILLHISNVTNHGPMDWKIIRRAPHHRQVWWDQSCPGLAAGGDSSWHRWRCCLSRGAIEWHF